MALTVDPSPLDNDFYPCNTLQGLPWAVLKIIFKKIDPKSTIRASVTCRGLYCGLAENRKFVEVLPWRISVEYHFTEIKPVVHSVWISVGWNAHLDEECENCLDRTWYDCHDNNTVRVGQDDDFIGWSKNEETSFTNTDIQTFVVTGKGGSTLKKILRNGPLIPIWFKLDHTDLVVIPYHIGTHLPNPSSDEFIGRRGIKSDASLTCNTQIGVTWQNTFNPGQLRGPGRTNFMQSKERNSFNCYYFSEVKIVIGSLVDADQDKYVEETVDNHRLSRQDVYFVLDGSVKGNCTLFEGISKKYLTENAFDYQTGPPPGEEFNEDYEREEGYNLDPRHYDLSSSSEDDAISYVIDPTTWSGVLVDDSYTSLLNPRRDVIPRVDMLSQEPTSPKMDDQSNDHPSPKVPQVLEQVQVIAVPVITIPVYNTDDLQPQRNDSDIINPPASPITVPVVDSRNETREPRKRRASDRTRVEFFDVDVEFKRKGSPLKKARTSDQKSTKPHRRPRPHRRNRWKGKNSR